MVQSACIVLMQLATHAQCCSLGHVSKHDNNVCYGDCCTTIHVPRYRYHCHVSSPHTCLIAGDAQFSTPQQLWLPCRTVESSSRSTSSVMKQVNTRSSYGASEVRITKAQPRNALKLSSSCHACSRLDSVSGVSLLISAQLALPSLVVQASLFASPVARAVKMSHAACAVRTFFLACMLLSNLTLT